MVIFKLISMSDNADCPRHGTVMNFIIILEDTKHVIKAVWRAWNPI